MLGLLSIFATFFYLVDGISEHGIHKSDNATSRMVPAMPTAGEPLNVTLEIFSGRRNPQWVLEPNNGLYREIRSQFAAAKKKGLTFRPIDMPSILGYKGFLLGSAVMVKPALIVGPKTVELQRLLVLTMSKDNQIREEIQKRLLRKIEKGGSPRPVVYMGRKKRHAPDYDPDLWNEPEFVRKKNNCYNYATNIRTNSFAQPGTRSLHYLPDVYNARDVMEAAQHDGLVTVEEEHLPDPGKYGPFFIPYAHKEHGHLVALIVSRKRFWVRGELYGPDHHWYRLDRKAVFQHGGQIIKVDLWSHKPGESTVTREDDDGDYILDPRYATYGDGIIIYDFVCFLTTTKETRVS